MCELRVKCTPIPRDEPKAELKGVSGVIIKIGPIHDLLTAAQCGRYGIEVKTDSLAPSAGTVM